MRRPPAAGLAALLALLTWTSAASAAPRDADDYVVPGSYIVVLEDSVRSVARQLAEHEAREGFEARRVYRAALKGYSARLSARQARELRADPQVASVEPNRIVTARETLAGGELVPTGVARIGAGSGSAGTANPASSAAVAVIDSGVDLDHPDLNVSSAGHNCITPGAPPDDDDGHGTHVAGSIGAVNGGSGLVGVAPGTEIVPVKVLDATGSGTWEQVICGINWVAENAARHGIQVANMSLGGLGSSADNGACGSTTALHQAICNATAPGIGVRFTVAAGNDAWPFPHSSAPDVPASYDEVITVTAYGDSDGLAGFAGAAPSCRSGEADDRYASFSNWSDNTADNAHTIAAPGVCINSTWFGPGAGYDTISGTSMAAPHVAGAAALCVGIRNSDGSSAPGPCASDTSPASLVTKLDSNDSAHGFTGDPFRPLSGRFYGYTAVAGTPAVAPPPPDFSLSASPTSRTIYRGQSTTYSISVDRRNGFDAAVAFSLSGLHSGASASFSPSSTTGSGSTLTIKTSSKTTRTTRTLTITGSGGGLARTVQVSLRVR